MYIYIICIYIYTYLTIQYSHKTAGLQACNIPLGIPVLSHPISLFQQRKVSSQISYLVRLVLPTQKIQKKKTVTVIQLYH